METIEKKFLDYFASKGFDTRENKSVFPSNHASTIFTSATVSEFIDQILAGEKIEKIALTQAYLRTQNLSKALTPGYAPEYMSYFRMTGIILPVEEFNFSIIEDFFTSLNVKPLIKTSKILKHKIFDSFGGYKKEVDSHEKKFYEWGYGNNRLEGRGVTFSLSDSNGNYNDIGNMVLIFLDGQPKFVEFGFGVEVFQARRDGTSIFEKSEFYEKLKPFELSDISMDLLISSFKMCDSMVTQENKRAFQLLRRSVKKLSVLSIIDHNSVKVRSAVETFSSPVLLELYDESKKGLEESIENYKNWLKMYLGKLDSEYFLKRVIKYTLRKGIPYVLIRKIDEQINKK